MKLEDVKPVWRLEEGSFTIGNTILPSKQGAEPLIWKKTFNLKTGKVKTQHSSPLQNFDRAVIHKYTKQVDVTLEYGRDTFFKDFFKKLEPETKTNSFLKDKNLSYKNLDVKMYEGFHVFRLGTCDNPDENAGFFFIDDKGKSFSITGGNDNAVLAYSQEDSNKVYFALDIEDGLTAYSLIQNGSVFVCLDPDNQKDIINRYAKKNFENTIIILEKNPSEKDLEGGKSPIDILDAQQKKYNELNIFIKNPPFGGSQSFFSYHQFFQISPEACLKNINKGATHFPKIKILGHTGGSVYVWSTHLDKPKELTEHTKYASLLLVAPDEYFLEKFKTRQPKIITNKLFELARGKLYESHKIKYCGVFPNHKKKLVINTGTKLIGEPDPNCNYIKVGKFPEPPKDRVDIDPKDFHKLYGTVFKNICNRNQMEGLSIFGWAILSLFAKALPTRYSLHLYGDSSAGKNFTQDEIIRPLHHHFKNVTRVYAPTCSFAAFKDDLREEGAYVFYLEETEGRNYDEKILQIIRSSTYQENFVKQMKGRGGQLKTPVSFMSMSTYNFEQEGYGQPDANRTYEVNYSLKTLDQAKKMETLSTLANINLEKLGKDCFFKMYQCWADFIRYYEKARLDPELFGLVPIGHKRNVFSQLWAMYKLTGLVSNETLKEYVIFLNDKERLEGNMDYNKTYIDSLLRIPYYDNEHFKRRDLRSLLTDPYSPISEQSDFSKWAVWLRHLKTNYRTKVHRKKDGQLVLYMPLRSHMIVKGMCHQGYPLAEAKSYRSIIEREYGERRTVRFDGEPRNCIGIPLHEICHGKAMEKWRNMDLEAIYLKGFQFFKDEENVKKDNTRATSGKDLK